MSAQCPPATYNVGTGVGVATLSAFGIYSLASTDVRIVGTFTIDQNSLWTLSGVYLTMSAGARIVVEPGSTLDASYTVFTNCGVPWDQIQILAGARIIADNCEFNGSNQVAVHVTGTSPQVTLTNNLFTGNANCVKISGTQNPAQIVITNNRFKFSSVGIVLAVANNVTIGYNIYQNNQAYSPAMTGIQVSNSANILINGGFMEFLTTGIDASGGSRLVTIKNIVFYGQNGVVANQCVHRLFLIQNSIRAIQFGVNIQNHLTSSAQLVNGNIFLDRNVITSQLNSAVRVANTIGDGVVDIYKNQIIPAFADPAFQVYGIEVSNTPDALVHIEANAVRHTPFITSTPPGGIYIFRSEVETILRNNIVLANTNGDLEFGITVAESPNSLVTGNSVDGGPNVATRAISVEMTPTDIQLCCNTVDNSIRGLNMSGPHENCHIYNTAFNTHTEGLYYDMVVSSSAPQFHRGNNWANASTSWDAYFNGNWIFAPFVFYTVDPALLPSGLTKVAVTGGMASDWFADITGQETSCDGTGSTELCDEVPGEGGQGPSGEDTITGNDEWAADNQEDPDYAALHYAARRQLYAKLERHPNLIEYSQAITDFYASAQTGTIGKLHTVDDELAHLYEPPVEIAEEYWALQTEISELYLDLIDLDEQIANAQPEDLPALLEQRDELTGQIETASAALQNHEATLATSVEQKIAELLELNSSVATTAVYEVNEQATNDILLTALSLNDWNFNTTEQGIIDGVAAGCPQYDGPAVYKARSLQEYYRIPDWSMSNCTPISERGRSAQVTGSFRVYPNPTSGIIQIELDRPVAADCRIQLFDLTGQLIRAQALTEGMTAATLQVGDLHKGHYFLQITDNSPYLHRQKIAIIH